MSTRNQFVSGFLDIKKLATGTTDVEQRVKDATNNDKWGASSTQMNEICRLSYQREHLINIMKTIWKRLNEPGKNWRHVYKVLILLEYMIANANERVIDECHDRVHMVQIRTLMRFEHIDEDGKDVGRSVRERAKKLIELLRDDDRIRQVREAGKKNRGKFVGISSNDSQPKSHYESYGSPVKKPWDDQFESVERKREEEREQERRRQQEIARAHQESESEESGDEDEEQEEPVLVDLGLVADDRPSSVSAPPSTTTNDLESLFTSVSVSANPVAPQAAWSGAFPSAVQATVMPAAASGAAPVSRDFGFDDTFSDFQPGPPAHVAVAPVPSPAHLQRVSVHAPAPAPVPAAPVTEPARFLPVPADVNEIMVHATSAPASPMGFDDDFAFNPRFADAGLGDQVVAKGNSHRKEQLTDLLSSSIVDFSLKDGSERKEQQKPTSKGVYRPMGPTSPATKTMVGATSQLSKGRQSLNNMVSPQRMVSSPQPSPQKVIHQPGMVPIVVSQPAGPPLSPSSAAHSRAFGGNWAPTAAQMPVPTGYAPQPAALVYPPQLMGNPNPNLPQIL